MIRRVRSRPPLAAAGLVIVGVIAWQAVTVGIAVQDIRGALSRLSSGELAASAWPAELDRLSRGLGVLHGRVAWLDPGLRLAAHLPLLGPEIGAARGLFGTGVELSAGAAALARLGVPDTTVQGEASFGSPRVIARHLREEPQIAEQAAQRFARAAAERRAWPAQPRLAALSRLTAPLDHYLPALEALAIALPEAGSALGTDGPRTYLVVAQNNQELRPGGGFIGSYATLTIDQGIVTDFSFGDSYQLDGRGGPIIFPPWPLQEFGGFPIWLFRDANWSADFPTNAIQLQEFYQRDRPTQLDGVIAVDLTAFQGLLGAAGPVEVPDFGETVTSENLLERVGQYIKYTGSAESQHKELLGAVGEQLAGRLLAPAPEQMPALARAVIEALSTKHILIAVNQPKLAEALKRANFDGHQAPADDDYLMIVDTNLSYNKVNTQIRRALAYNVQHGRTGPVGASATLTVTYHFEPATSPRRIALYDEYRNYARIYLPTDMRIEEVSGFLSAPEITRDGDKLVIGGFLVVHPGQSEAVRVRYTLLESERRGRPYRLLIQKQPGIGADQVALTVTSREGRDLVSWEGDLSRDAVFASAAGPVAEPRSERRSGALLSPTDGILASFVRRRTSRLAVDNLQGRHYTGLGF